MCGAGACCRDGGDLKLVWLFGEGHVTERLLFCAAAGDDGMESVDVDDIWRVVFEVWRELADDWREEGEGWREDAEDW